MAAEIDNEVDKMERRNCPCRSRLCDQVTIPLISRACSEGLASREPEFPTVGRPMRALSFQKVRTRISNSWNIRLTLKGLQTFHGNDARSNEDVSHVTHSYSCKYRRRTT